eukprot:GFUD01045012.1.p1 GENE.GFUD01045012.1~~GFUD01045012.1.p1  ORF type:complete len:496 (+),score=109.92 GFUD01045012.1:65-1552(+)
MCCKDPTSSPTFSIFPQVLMKRSTSPLPNIQKALFQSCAPAVNKPTRKRSSRPSLEDDLKKASSSPLLGPDQDQENMFVPRRLSSKVSKSSCTSPSPRVVLSDETNPRPRGLSTRDTNVFRFSSSQYEFSPPPPKLCPRVPRISVHGEDDVFDPNFPPAPPPASSKLLLTPSTAHTPRFHYSSSSSMYLSSLIPSPSIEKGMCCNTPNRLRLEEDGLGTNKFVLGRGAYGTVVLGQYKGKKAAIKVMEREEGGKSARRRKSLESELHAIKLDHENIVQVFEVHAEDDRYAVIIMEYVGSRNLHRLLVELREKTLGSSWLLEAARQVSSALAHCHSKGILHMDIKAANILVSSQGVCKVGDFGCSVSTSLASLSVDHSLVGTPGYQAPEFLRGCRPTPACDIYSLAILMWQMDSREIPFSGQHPQTVMFRVVSAGVRPPPPPSHMASINLPSFTSLYQSCWDKNQANRPTAQQVMDSITKMLGAKEKSRLRVRSLR